MHSPNLSRLALSSSKSSLDRRAHASPRACTSISLRASLASVSLADDRLIPSAANRLKASRLIRLGRELIYIPDFGLFSRYLRSSKILYTSRTTPLPPLTPPPLSIPAPLPFWLLC